MVKMKKSYFKHIAALLLFGTNGVVASFIPLTSYQIVFLRTLIGSGFLAALFLLQRPKRQAGRTKKDYLFMAASGISMGASWMFLYEGYAQVGVSVATLVYYCGPVFVMAASPLLFREKLRPAGVLGFAAVFCGIFLLNCQSADGVKNVRGFAFSLLSALTYALMVVFNKKNEHIKGTENSLLQMLISFLTVAAFLGIRGGFGFTLSGGSIFWTLILGLVNTGFGCYLYFSSIGELPVQSVAVLGYLEPLSAVVFSAVFLGESLTALKLAGTALIIGGALFAERSRRTETAKSKI